MTLADFLAFELYFEPAAAALLHSAGFPVASPFVQVDAAGNALEEVPSDSVCVRFLPGRSNPQVRFFATNSRGEQREITGEYTGTLEIARRVPTVSADSAATAAAGAPWPGCYPQLLRDLGRIRELFLEDNDPFRESLSAVDILSIELIEPDKTVERLANQATDRFLIRFAPADGALT